MKFVTFNRVTRQVVFLSLLASWGAWGEDKPAEFAYHYVGSLTVQPEKGYINVHWMISIMDPQTSDISFVLRSSLGEIKAYGAALLNTKVEPSNLGSDFQEIHLQLAPGEGSKTRLIELSYDGILLPEPMPNRINQVTASIIELNVDSFWLPINKSFNKLMTAELDIKIGKGWQAVAEGRLSANDDGFTLYKEKPGLDIAFTLARHPRVEKHQGYSLYDLRTGTQDNSELVSAIDFCVAGLDKRYGQAKPLEQLQFTITERATGGYARGNYIALTEVKNTDAARLTQFVCHELAHHWSQGGKFDTVENWLNEGFAEYVGMRMLRERSGEDAFAARVAQFRKQLEGKILGPIWTAETIERPDYLVSYRKAPLALFALETKIGNQAFDKFVTAYMVESTSTTSRLLEQLEASTDKQSMVWFRQLLAQ